MEREKNLNYPLVMSFCCGAILVIICVWYFVSGIGDGLLLARYNVRNDLQECIEKCGNCEICPK